MEMDSQNFGHMHPVVFNEELSNETQEASCSRCGEAVSGPSFTCAECSFSLHKKCAEAPSKIDHPFHRDHPLVLLTEEANRRRWWGWNACSFCGKVCDLFAYHCSCDLNFHIKCALLTLNIAEQQLVELKQIATKEPPIFLEDGDEEVGNAKCFGCWVALGKSSYFSIDCGFNLHKKCSELPRDINHPFHKQHALVLQFNGERLFCKICHKIQRNGFVYSCSACKFALHIECAELPIEISNPSHRRHPLVLQLTSENLPCKACQQTEPREYVYSCLPCKFALHTECASPPPIIKGAYHQHPFTLFWRQASFICDGCGLEGNSVSYMCSTCNLVIHRKCISIPPVIRVPRHYHPISHNYFLSKKEFQIWDCEYCDNEVNMDYGSYFCSDCDFIAHVKCATEREGWYRVIEANEKPDDDSASFNPITRVIERSGSGEMTRIRHFSHAHDLILSDNVMDNDKTCDGCMLLISSSFYYCSSQCDVFLHKTCAESPGKKAMWSHRCLRPLVLVVGYIFKCKICKCECSGFSYTCTRCNDHYCLRCSTSGYRITNRGHEHPLLNIRKYESWCNACREVKKSTVYKCKRCDFNLHRTCSMLPVTTRHKSDEHPLALTYHEGNDYSEYLYCDICEKERDPNLWFYHCATCDFSAHTMCVLGSYLFIKPGSGYKAKDHPHPLVFVQKAYSYPGCYKCSKPCQDLALECAESTCNFIVHWNCVKPPISTRRPVALYEIQEENVIAHEPKTSQSVVENKSDFNVQ